ncbi:putative [Escherichia phage Mu]|uniref:Bacteriophage Mu left end n=1 Tax=Escherichia phage Mu TaxID=2681603 RepID=Q38487_BPMU|nr:putative [Escherichia phage Mu]
MLNTDRQPQPRTLSRWRASSRSFRQSAINWSHASSAAGFDVLKNITPPPAPLREPENNQE